MGGDDKRDEQDLRWQAGDARSVQDGFEQMPSLMAATQGPEHTIVAANAAFRAFVRQPDLIGRPARQVLLAFPRQQLADLLDLVYAAGKPFTGRGAPPKGHWRARKAGGSPREGARSEARAEQRLAAGGRRLPRPGSRDRVLADVADSPAR